MKGNRAVNRALSKDVSFADRFWLDSSHNGGTGENSLFRSQREDRIDLSGSSGRDVDGERCCRY
jgi:hypothetical protein